jgi:hypothetical protein
VAHPQVNLGHDTLICTYDTLWLDAGSNESCLWFNGDTSRWFPSSSSIPVPGGKWFSVVVREKHCYASDSILIGFTQPAINLGRDTVICKGDVFYLDVGLGYLSYLWSDGSTNWYWIADSTTGTREVSVRISDMQGCYNADTMRLEIKECPLPPVNPDDWQLLLYPNPNKGKFILAVVGAHPEINFRMMDAHGRLVRTWQIAASRESSLLPVDLYTKAAGVYLIEANSGKKKIVERLVTE